MSDNRLNILIFGAHPDDADIKAGGVAALYGGLGHCVKMVSVTNGDAGHHEIGGAPLAWRRREEAAAAGRCLGAEYIALDNHDGKLMPTLENRSQIIEIMRAFKPDLVMVHRPNDYHPDHRYTSQLVQDASYLVTVPNVVSQVPHLTRMPVVVYLSDTFQKPYPFLPDVVIDVDAVMDRKWDALHCHTSQMYEWLPYNGGYLDQVPDVPALRRSWLQEVRGPRMRQVADSYRERLIEKYGRERGSRVQYAEAFELCEYGATPDEDDVGRLFPF